MTTDSDATVQRIERPLRIDDLAPGRTHRLLRIVATMADGGTVGLPVNVLVGRSARPRVVAIAGVHGDEHDGPAALLEASVTLDPVDLAGTLVIVPVANPPAFRSNRRFDPADGTNMNRIFPADPEGPIGHRLAAALVDEVVAGADFVLTIHGWTAGWLTVPYVEYTAGHPTSDASRAGAAAFGLDFIEPLPLLPGRLMSQVADLGIPGCEAEIGGEGITRPERAAIAMRGIVGLLRQIGLLEGEIDRPSGQREVARRTVVAPAGGAFRRPAGLGLGAAVAKGAPLGTICGLNGEPLAELIVPADGVLATLRHALPIEPGDLVAAIFSDR